MTHKWIIPISILDHIEFNKNGPCNKNLNLKKDLCKKSYFIEMKVLLYRKNVDPYDVFNQKSV